MHKDQADALAERFHAGQVDQAGLPYITHPRRVAARLGSPDEIVTALLHDLMEDTELADTDLHCAGVPPHVVEALRLLTHAPDESYLDYVTRAAANPLARAVKLADIADNSDPARLALLDPERATRLSTKYQAALERIATVDPVEPTTLIAEIFRPKGTTLAWHTAYCAVHELPAGTLEILFSAPSDELHLVCQSFMGTASSLLSADGSAQIWSAISNHDDQAIFAFNSELAPWWCPQCRASYCSRCISTLTRYDDGFYDCTDGTCPKGHTRTLWD